MLNATGSSICAYFHEHNRFFKAAKSEATLMCHLHLASENMCQR